MNNLIYAYGTYTISEGWVFHINKWYESDSLILVDKKLLDME